MGPGAHTHPSPAPWGPVHARTHAPPCSASLVWGRYLGGAVSNSDADHDDISMSEMYARYNAWVAELSGDERHELFVGSARRFYRIHPVP